jgi:tetratricopeptide (TPR) repeat protein
MALHCNLGVNCDQRNDLASAENEFRTAIKFGGQAYKINPLISVSRLLLALSNDNLADVLLRTGRHQEAFSLVNEALQLWPCEWWSSKPVFTRYQECAKAASVDPQLSAAERADVVKKCQERTMEVLTDLVTGATYSTQDLPHFLKSETALDHVRHRADFQQLEQEAIEKYSK